MSLPFPIVDISQGEKVIISCLVIFDDNFFLPPSHLYSASVDNLRLWNVADSGEDAWGKPRSGVQFKIIPGHHGGYISQMREYLSSNQNTDC